MGDSGCKKDQAWFCLGFVSNLVSFRLVLPTWCMLWGNKPKGNEGMPRAEDFASVSNRLALKLILVLPTVLDRLVLKLTVQSGYKYYRFTTVLYRMVMKRL